MNGLTGTDAPICQDTRSGGLDELLASAEIGHDALVDLASEKTFQAPDDLPFGPAVRRAACHVLNGRLMVPHADDDSAIEGRVGVAVAATTHRHPPVSWSDPDRQGDHAHSQVNSPRGTMPRCTLDDPATFGIAFRLTSSATLCGCTTDTV